MERNRNGEDRMKVKIEDNRSKDKKETQQQKKKHPLLTTCWLC
jgi:hypothetical protein